MPEQLSRAAIVALAEAAGLHLPPTMQDDLVVAYDRVQRLLANLPPHFPRGLEPAHIFDPERFMPPLP